MPSSNAAVTATNTQSCQQGNESLNTAYQTEHIANFRTPDTLHKQSTV